MRLERQSFARVLVAFSAILSGCNGSTSSAKNDGAMAGPSGAPDGFADALSDGSSVGDASIDHGDGSTGPQAGGCSGDPTPFPCMPNSIFNQALPTNPQLAANSSAILAYYSANWDFDYAGAPTWNKGIQMWPDDQAIYDSDMAAVYFAEESDPVYTVKCFESYCANGGEPIDGVQIHIPTGAKWQGYPDCSTAGANQTSRGSCGDDHFTVISPDRTTEYDLYEAFGCFRNGTTCLVGAGGIVSYATSKGFSTQGGSNASNWVPTQGLVLPSEIMAGVISHAFSLILPCSDGTTIAPSTGYGIYACPDKTNALALGQRIFLDATDTQIESWGSAGVSVPGQIILKALAHYGAYYVDNLGYGGLDFTTIQQYSYQSPGTLTDDWPAVAAKYSLPTTGFASGYDLGLAKVPGGISTWLKACAKTGC
jgi:hypothetical protein